MKRTICIVMLLFSLSSALPSKAYADLSGTQVITVSIPCTVTLHIGEHGAVQVNGKNYTGDTFIQAPIGTALTYAFLPYEGYQLSTLTYDGSQVNGSAKGGVYSAPPLAGNTVLSATFAKYTSPPGITYPPVPTYPTYVPTMPTSPYSYAGTGVRTGDESNLSLWSALLLSSGAGLMVLAGKQRKRRQT